MNSINRVNLALRHEIPDRIPLDLGGNQTGIHKIAYKNLINFLGFKDEIKIIDANQQLAQPSEEVLNYFNIDTRHVIQITELSLKKVNPGFIGYKDIWGITRGYRTNSKENIMYLEIIKNPLANFKLKDLSYYDWPDPLNKDLITFTNNKARELKQKTDFAVVSRSINGIFEQCWKMRGMENFLIDLISNKPFAERLLDIITDYVLEFCDAYLDKAGKYFDVIFIYDDIAMQNGPMLSPGIYKEMIKPRHKMILDKIHSKTHAKICYHSCGSIIKFIDDFIEIGVDFLNPVQLSAYGMDAFKLKSNYGEKIGFWGGGVDTQKIFPFGKPEDIINDVRKNIKTLMTNGGYIFNPIHCIQPDVPPENIIAAFKAAIDYGKYCK